MTCQQKDFECTNPIENPDTGLCSSCGREKRRADKEASRPKKKPARIAKVGTKNLFECSDGTKVTQDQINYRLGVCYHNMDLLMIGAIEKCEGCGYTLGLSHAHIIPQARCKRLRKTDLIWCPGNIFYGCFACNAAIENPKGQEWTKLKNIQRCMQFIMENDQTLYAKFQIKAIEIGFSMKTEEPHPI